MADQGDDVETPVKTGIKAGSLIKGFPVRKGNEGRVWILDRTNTIHWIASHPENGVLR